MSGFQRLCIATCAVVFALIVIGGIVRATDSGLGCPDWPKCHGSFIPRWEQHTLIEYTHRATGTVAGFLGLSLLIVAWTRYRQVPAITYPTTLGFVLGLIQAGLGGAVVLNELPPEIVVVHLAMALTIIGLLILLTTTASALDGRMSATVVSPGIGRLAIAAAAGVLVLALVGSYVAGAGYSLACSGWPLCNGNIVPTEGVASVQVIFLHRVLALLVGIILVALAVLAWRERDTAPVVAGLATGALALFIVQSLVGAANIWTDLADGVAALHLALAALLWVLVALVNIRVHGLYALLPFEAQTRSTSKMAGVTR